MRVCTLYSYLLWLPQVARRRPSSTTSLICGERSSKSPAGHVCRPPACRHCSRPQLQAFSPAVLVGSQSVCTYIRHVYASIVRKLTYLCKLKWGNLGMCILLTSTWFVACCVVNTVISLLSFHCRRRRRLFLYARVSPLRRETRPFSAGGKPLLLVIMVPLRKVPCFSSSTASSGEV